MIIDDDSLLSAYMDGQLSPDQQLLVESALVSDPQLGEELRGLTVVRDLLAGLPRPAAVDVTSRVRGRIPGTSRLQKILAMVPGRALVLRRPARAVGRLGVAAGLLIAVLLTFFHIKRPAAPHEQAGLRGGNVASLPIALIPSPDPLDAPDSRWPLFASHQNREGAPSRSVAEVNRAGDARRPAASSGALEHVGQYLDNPDLRQMFLVSDLMDSSAQRQVATVVEQTTRFNYYKITIAQGIVIDPRHPDEATVFALVVNSSELSSLRDRLRTVFLDRVEEAPIDPQVVTQLADIGHVQACPPSPMADVVIPREALALAIRTPGAESGERPAPEKPLDRDRPTPEQERSSPAADLAALKAKGHESRRSPGPADSPDQGFVVLVWVSRPRSG